VTKDNWREIAMAALDRAEKAEAEVAHLRTTAHWVKAATLRLQKLGIDLWSAPEPS
jgi:hypothetical protein